MCFRNENLTFPFPSIKTIIGPYAPGSGAHGVDCYCDVFYFDTRSIDYSLFFHIRMTETQKHRKPICSPVESQIKPPIIRLPFLFLKNDIELQTLSDMIEANMPEFTRMKGEIERDCDEPDDVRRRTLAERLFSKWLFELWNRQKEAIR